jgi:hypothetical protein
MRFLIDANLPRAAIVVCQKSGHLVEFARDIGLAAASDALIAERARESGAALLTRDLDIPLQVTVRLCRMVGGARRTHDGLSGHIVGVHVGVRWASSGP